MSEHSTLSFDELHKSKIESGLEADRPSVPEDVGDVWFSTDIETLYLTNTAGTLWHSYDMTTVGSSITLDDLTDVNTTGATNGQVLTFNAGNWTPDDPTALITLQDLTDVATFTAAKGDILVYNGSIWTHLPVGANNDVIVADSSQTTGLRWDTVSGITYDLDDLGDVSISLPAKGNLLVNNGTNFINIAVGSNGSALVADSAQATGVKWDSTIASAAADIENTHTLVWLGW